MPDYDIQRYRGALALVFRQDGKRKRYSLGTNDPRRAAELAPALYARLTRPRGKTVAELWEGYQKDMAGRAVLATMAHTWKALSSRFGPLQGDEITIEDCRAHVEARRAQIDPKRGRGIQDGTIHTELGHLRMILLWAKKHGLLKEPSYIERPGKPKPKELHLTPRQVKAMIDAAKFPHTKVFIHLAYATAGRLAAILGLTWDRCDFERGKIDLEDPEIKVPHKGRAVVPMTRTIRATLLEIRPGALSPFVIEWDGGRVRSVKKGIQAAATQAGLGKVSPHMLRHSAAVRMAEIGIPMEEIASYLGHSDVNVTRRVYARFSPDALRGAADALELDDLAPVVRVNLRRA